MDRKPDPELERAREAYLQSGRLVKAKAKLTARALERLNRALVRRAEELGSRKAADEALEILDRDK